MNEKLLAAASSWGLGKFRRLPQFEDESPVLLSAGFFIIIIGREARRFPSGWRKVEENLAAGYSNKSCSSPLDCTNMMMVRRRGVICKNYTRICRRSICRVSLFAFFTFATKWTEYGGGEKGRGREKNRRKREKNRIRWYGKWYPDACSYKRTNATTLFRIYHFKWDVFWFIIFDIK